MLLLAHKCSLELTLSTQLKDMAWIHKSHKDRACKEWLRSSAKTLGTATLHYRRLGGIYTPQRRKLAVSCQAAPTSVRPVPLTGQTGLAQDTPKTLSFTLTLHQRDEVSQISLGGFVSTLLGPQGYFHKVYLREFWLGQLANVASHLIVRHIYTQE
jgi:hypothetical protein